MVGCEEGEVGVEIEWLETVCFLIHDGVFLNRRELCAETALTSRR